MNTSLDTSSKEVTFFECCEGFLHSFVMDFLTMFNTI